MNTPGIRVLCLVTDGFGGRGGIALHCRHLLNALCQCGQIDQVHAIPRVRPLNEEFENADTTEILPAKLAYHHKALARPFGYLRALLRIGVFSRSWDVIITEHINLLPAAAVLSRLNRGRLILITHGFEAWTRPPRFFPWTLRQVNHVVSVSAVTRSRFIQWSGYDPDKASVIPNAMDFQGYSPGPRPAYLQQRYGVDDQPVIMTLGRLSADERAKGFDQVINLLPGLHDSHPQLHYLIVGSGDDQPRLQDLAREVGVLDKVIFTGEIGESEKVDHYRLADAYIMPSRLEGFGYVFLEAMACGLPVVGSTLDGSHEALLGGRLGELVDPDDPIQLTSAINTALTKPNQVPDELTHFSLERFSRSIQNVVMTQ